MQHFLKPAARTARAEIVPAEFFDELLVAMNDAEARCTFVSDGKPLRRLLLGSKKKFAAHGSLSFQMDCPSHPEGKLYRQPFYLGIAAEQ